MEPNLSLPQQPGPSETLGPTGVHHQIVIHSLPDPPYPIPTVILRFPDLPPGSGHLRASRRLPVQDMSRLLAPPPN